MKTRLMFPTFPPSSAIVWTSLGENNKWFGIQIKTTTKTAQVFNILLVGQAHSCSSTCLNTTPPHPPKNRGGGKKKVGGSEWRSEKGKRKKKKSLMTRKQLLATNQECGPSGGRGVVYSLSTTGLRQTGGRDNFFWGWWGGGGDFSYKFVQREKTCTHPHKSRIQSILLPSLTAIETTMHGLGFSSTG